MSPAVYYAARRMKVPVVQTIHNFRLLCPGATFYRDGHICEDCVEYGLKCAVKHSCYRESKIQTLACVLSTAFHRMTGIYGKINYICLTDFNKKKLLELKQIKPERVFVKPNFVECKNEFIPEKDRKDQFVFAGRDVYKRQVVKSIKNHNYEMYQMNGVIVLDRDMTGEDIEGVPVVANAENVAEFLRQSWVDEVFINLDESIPYPKELIERCSEMGLTVHLNLVKITNSTLGKQSIGKVGEYTVLTTSINYMTMRQAFLKRTMDIAAGLAGCIATGIIFVFVAPIIYISSPGPIFFSQERVGQKMCIRDRL